MKVLIAGGSGFIGQYLVTHFNKQNSEVVVLGRSIGKIEKAYGQSVGALTWDQLDEQGAEALAEYDLIINLAGVNIGAKRWTRKRRQAIISSRVVSTEKLARYCANIKERSPVLFNASAVGIYGLQKELSEGLPPALDESSFIDFNEYSCFLAKVGRLWEQATIPAKNAGVRVVNLRFGVVLGRHGGVLQKLLLPFKFYVGGIIGSGRQPFSWVSIVDLADAISFLFEREQVKGPVNIVAPECIMQAELAHAIAKELQLPSFFHTPALAMRLAYGDMADELILHGTHVVPKRLAELGFVFKQKTIKQALSYALRDTA